MVIVGTHTQEERERRKGGWSEKERGVRGTGSRGLVNTHTRAYIHGASWVGCKRGVSRGWARVMVTGCAMVWWPALILHPRTHVSRETYSW